MKRESYYLDLITRILNEETTELSSSSSSSLQLDKYLFSVTRDHTFTSSVTESAFSSKNNSDISLSSIERLIVKRNAEDEEHQKDELVARLVNELEDALNVYEYEVEGMSSAEKKIIEIEKKYKMRILGEVLQEIYMHHFNNSSYLVGVCTALLRYDLDEVRPWGAAILTGFINHPDERVKEATVQLIDNWSDVELLPILKTLQVSSAWMRDYINDVVESLERINVLYQKTI